MGIIINGKSYKPIVGLNTIGKAYIGSELIYEITSSGMDLSPFYNMLFIGHRNSNAPQGTAMDTDLQTLYEYYAASGTNWVTSIKINPATGKIWVLSTTAGTTLTTILTIWTQLSSPRTATTITFAGRRVANTYSGILHFDAEGNGYFMDEQRQWVKVDSNGNMIWDNFINSYPYNNTAQRVDYDGNGYLLSGYARGLRKIATTGEEIWTLVDFVSPSGLNVTNDNFIYVYSGSRMVKVNPSGSIVSDISINRSGGMYIFFDELNSVIYTGNGSGLSKRAVDGTEIWYSTYASSSTAASRVGNIVLTENGLIVVAHARFINVFNDEGTRLDTFTRGTAWDFALNLSTVNTNYQPQ